MEGDPRNPRVSLLKKYDIPVEHLSYEYVRDCSNKKELERIVRILRSGEEGSYPDLLKVSEERLRVLAPESRVLRVETPILTKECLSQEERSEVENDLLSWENEMKIMDKSLDFEKSRVDTIGNKNLPEVRKVVQPKPNKDKEKSTAIRVTENKQTRIKSGDYAAWDKFDVDKELLKIDVEEERKQEENEKKLRESKKLQKNKKVEIIDIDKENYSSMEQQVLANQAKDRGNECYKSGDLDNALKYYEISIRLYPTAHAYNNRAMTYIKLKQYENALKDCNKVLEMENKNIKALHRRATAYQNMSSTNGSDNYDHLAMQDLYEIIHLEPNNKVAQADFQKLKKKLNIEDSGKKFRMHISEETEEKNKQIERKNFSTIDNNTSIDKLPLTYYGPSTSSFQCEPYSMMHRALSGSPIPGQVLCKCNSNRLRQNPLCQKCGEAMCTPKPSKAIKAASDSKFVSKRENEVKNEIHLKKTSKSNEALPSAAATSNKTEKEVESQKIAKSSLKPEIIKAEEPQQKTNSVDLKGEAVADDNNNPNCGTVNEKKVVSSNIEEVPKKKVDFTEKGSASEEAVSDSNKQNNLELISREVKDEVSRVEMTDRKSSSNEPLKEAESLSSKNSGALITENNSSQVDNVSNSKKSKHKKKKSKEHRENNDKMRKHFEPFKTEPVKVVHAAKYLHPTSVEPKVKTETSLESQRETNISNNTHYKAFVPNRKCYSSDCSRLLPPPAVTQPLASKKVFKEEIGNYSSIEGNKENISECQRNSNIEIGGKEDGGEEMKKEVVDSAYEFMKAWEELKKFDESYAKRAEIIRKLRPCDLGRVIGIKLDSDMLSCLLECLLRHIVDTDPKRVIDLLNQLPKVPRFGLVNMFLADTDKKKMKKLIETAEGKGFKLDEDVKKNLTTSS